MTETQRDMPYRDSIVDLISTKMEADRKSEEIVSSVQIRASVGIILAKEVRFLADSGKPLPSKEYIADVYGPEFVNFLDPIEPINPMRVGRV